MCFYRAKEQVDHFVSKKNGGGVGGCMEDCFKKVTGTLAKHDSGVSSFQSTSCEVPGTRPITMLTHSYATFSENK